MAKGMGLFYFFWHGIKFPLWLISRIFGKKPKKKRTEREEKQRKYVWNFAKRNISWQKGFKKRKKSKNN